MKKMYKIIRPKETIELSFAEIFSLIPYVKRDDDPINETGKIIEPLSNQSSKIQRRVVQVSLSLLKKSSAYERLMGSNKDLDGDGPIQSEESVQKSTEILLNNSKTIAFTKKYIFNIDKLMILMILMSSYWKVNQSSDREVGLYIVTKATEKDSRIDKKTAKLVKEYVKDYYQPVGWSEKIIKEFSPSENKVIEKIKREPIFNETSFYDKLLDNDNSLIWSKKNRFKSINEKINDKNFEYFITFLFSICDRTSIDKIFSANENPFLSYVKKDIKGVAVDEMSFKENVQKIKGPINLKYPFNSIKELIIISCIEDFSLFFGQITRPEYNKKKLLALIESNTKELKELNDIVGSYRDDSGKYRIINSPLRAYYEEELAHEIKRFKKNISSWIKYR